MTNGLSFQIGEPKTFAKEIEAMSKLIEEANFEATEDRVKMVAMDPSHVALARLELKPTELNVGGNGGKIGVNLEELNTILKRLNNDDDFVKISDENDKIKVEFIGTNRTFTLDRSDINEAELPEPKLAFTATATIAVKVLKDILKDIEAIKATNVKLGATSDRVVLADGESKYIKTLQKGDCGLMGLSVCKSCGVSDAIVANYNLDYLDKLINKKFNEVKLSWSHDMPLRTEYLNGTSTLEFLLAPRIESD